MNHDLHAPSTSGSRGRRLGTPSGAARFIPGSEHASFYFLALVSLATFAADIGSKGWAEARFEGYPGFIDVVPGLLTFALAHNRGGAWGLLQGTDERLRRPFFLLVSAAAIAFIVMLYRRLAPRQRALQWGLPLVLGGALGNVFDRIRYGHVVDFIDVHTNVRGRELHWPTFNVADVAICVGVGLMALDMFTAKKPPAPARSPGLTSTRPAPGPAASAAEGPNPPSGGRSQ